MTKWDYKLVYVHRKSPQEIEGLVAPQLCEWEEVSVPTVGWDLVYDHAHTHGRMIRVYHVDRKGTFDLLEHKLAEHAPH